jgi:hypothetical protein
MIPNLTHLFSHWSIPLNIWYSSVYAILYLKVITFVVVIKKPYFFERLLTASCGPTLQNYLLL